MASEMAEHGAGEGEGPSLSLPAFNGSLSLLLSLARAQQIDLAHLSLPDLLDQLSTALAQARTKTSLGEKGSWLVMAAWLVLLRSRISLPADTAAQLAAEEEAGQLRDRLVDLRAAQALASWLEDRPQLCQDVFARGQPELIGSLSRSRHEVDVVAFLWACLTLFDDGAADADTTEIYTPPWHGLHSAGAARHRILRLLPLAPHGAALGAFLPPVPAEDDRPDRTTLRRRSAWSSTLVASLELSRQGVIELRQEEGFGDILLRRAADDTSPGEAAQSDAVTALVG
jgi:segregation and condensation protein A